MCGISGFWTPEQLFDTNNTKLIGRCMAASLHHRGPDDSGVWLDPSATLLLGHRRLSIIDLSPNGHQPMASATGRYVLVYNGEIYNFQQLRDELATQGHTFRGHSDTEVMLAAFSEWGIVESLSRFNGMFAIAVWDCQERELILVRDRLGQKPLYVGWADHSLLFASELKALRPFPFFKPSINHDALTLLLRRVCINAPYSIFQQVYKVKPGCYIRITQDQMHTHDKNLVQVPYWSATKIFEAGADRPFQGSIEEASAQLDALLHDAVKLCMISDVPLGSFLSGGIDSSLITALMQRQSTQPIRTFSIGFHEQHYNEANHAAAIANHLETDHTELYVSEQDALDVIPQLPQIYDEPFADSSQIPTYLLSKLTRQHVTVALSDDGGDELFGGYAKYAYLQRLQRLTYLPRPLCSLLIGATRHLPVPSATRLHAMPLGSVAHWLATHDFKRKSRRLSTFLDSARSPAQMYTHLASIWKDPKQVVLNATEPPSLLTTSASWPKLAHPVRQAMAVDTLTYLPDDILVKVDRAAMAVSLETRIPLLDHRVVEFAARIPLAMNLQNGQNKLLLRKLLHRYVPPALVERPKMGFKIPLDIWLRQELRPWAEALLEPRRLLQEGFFAPDPVQKQWQSHLVGQRDWSGYLWPILMFQAWQESWMFAKPLKDVSVQ